VSLGTALASAGANLIEDKGADWIDKAIVKGASLAGDLETPEERAKAREALEVLRAGRKPLARLGSLGFAKMTVFLSEDDDEDQARRHYLEHEATFEEKRAAMHAGTDALINSQDADNAACDAAVAVLKQVAGLALPFLLKLAAASVGIPL